jgi:hypothetical protein
MNIAHNTSSFITTIILLPMYLHQLNKIKSARFINEQIYHLYRFNLTASVV